MNQHKLPTTPLHKFRTDRQTLPAAPRFFRNGVRLVLLLATLMGIVGTVIVGARHSPPSAGAGQVTLDPDTAVSSLSTDARIALWYGRVQQHPHDYLSLTYLAQAYLQKARESGDADNYNRAGTALQAALAHNPDDELALALLATVRLSQHDFAGALEIARRVYDYNPGAVQALATIGDAHLELGHYAEAEAAYGELQARHPGPAVYGRLARLAWLKGEPEQALAWMKQAVAEAAALAFTGEQLAWYQCQLGELYFQTGQLTAAENQYRQADETLAGYYLAQAGLGQVRAAQGDIDGAIALYEPLAAGLPQPDFLATLSDLYTLKGDTAAAQKQADTIGLIAALAESEQSLYSRPLALYYANHDIHLETALALARRELAQRGDIYAYDAYAWALYKNGRYSEAAAAMAQALSLGTQDAQLYYHAGLIEAASGRTETAVARLQMALQLNPHFDLLQARTAQETLTGLTHE